MPSRRLVLGIIALFANVLPSAWLAFFSTFFRRLWRMCRSTSVWRHQAHVDAARRYKVKKQRRVVSSIPLPLFFLRKIVRFARNGGGACASKTPSRGGDREPQDVELHCQVIEMAHSIQCGTSL